MRPIHVMAPDDWTNEKKREMVLREMWKGTTGYPDEFYAAKDTYREEAGKCFNRHERPKQGCIDWHDHSKKLTDSKWKERGAAMGEDREDVYLCHFCPVSSWVQLQVGYKRGDYK